MEYRGKLKEGELRGGANIVIPIAWKKHSALKLQSKGQPDEKMNGAPITDTSTSHGEGCTAKPPCFTVLSSTKLPDICKSK